MSLEILDDGKKEAGSASRPFNKISESEKWMLFEDILTSGSALRLKVTGISMAPFLRGGEVLILKKANCSSLKRGDLILFRSPLGISILHRIVRIKCGKNGVSSFQTKGDRLIAFDEPVFKDEILGKVCVVEKGTKSIDMETKAQIRRNYLIAVTGLFRSRISFALNSFKQVISRIFPPNK